jgi:hypothetical protein
MKDLEKSGWTYPAFLNPIPTPTLPLKVREFLDGGCQPALDFRRIIHA